ncbi:unnamed protein product [Paramecium octaurelia]|uniref:Uncharacterized protein n=1 Tax=Paramecium octaurelia TaxID=43137 RepID=A0A8S1WJI3_PAROT|nr:unnamed protein product [Paramecium octaurelia]
MPLGIQQVLNSYSVMKLTCQDFGCWKGVKNNQIAILCYGIRWNKRNRNFRLFAQPVVLAKFSNQRAFKIILYNKGGKTVDSFISIIKIQDYYSC